MNVQVPQSDFHIDFASARGSNTGDEYHELWAARHALRLLGGGDGLSAVTVEGLISDDGAEKAWEGVDCGLLFGAENEVDADRVEIQQLKYSGSNPSGSWTVARLCTGKDGSPKTSPLRRLANAYKGLLERRPGKSPDSIHISLVSNQPVAPGILTLLEDAQSAVPAAYSRAWKTGMPDLHRLVHASGMKPAEFQDFARVLDLQGSCGSRFEAEDRMLKAISECTDTELHGSASRIREYIRKRMLPEAAGETITREKVLVQFAGVSEDHALFPCRSKIEAVTSAVPRPIAGEIVARMRSGTRHLCLHGSGGAGKTTTLQQIEQSLPAGSLMAVFDCYGAGSYLDASELRHRPQDAFVQLANEISQQLRLPLLLVPSATRDYPRAFRKRLEVAAAAMAAIAPDALLVVAVDAADNSVLAAQTRSPPESSFVHDLVTMDGLPANVRILISARSGRLDDIRLPAHFEKFALPVFSAVETTSNVRRHWDAPQPWIDDFHHFSGGVPRVQAYAFKNAGSEAVHAIDALRPFGKNLDQVFREQFQLALRKNANETDLADVCAGLIALPRPIPVGDLAAVLAQPEAKVSDICSDLAPGVRLVSGLLSFADEDFESFVRSAAEPSMAKVQARAAEHFLDRAASHAYAALNVAPALLAADRKKDLLALVEREPLPPLDLMPDPIRRREVQLQRLQVAIRACREARDTAHALRFVLIGAEAIKTEEATLERLVANPALTARYARDTASRLVLGDPRKIAAHGPLLLHLLAEDAARGDAISVREGWRRFAAWESARRDHRDEEERHYGQASGWQILPGDAGAVLYATMVLDGPTAAVAQFRRFAPRPFAFRSAMELVHRLLAEGKARLVEQAAAHLSDVEALFLLVPLATAGSSVDLQRIARGLHKITRRTRQAGAMLARAQGTGDSVGPWIIDSILAAAELLIARQGDQTVALAALTPFLDPDLRRIDKVHDSQHLLLDAILRAVTLSDAMARRGTQPSQVLTPRPVPSEEEKQKSRHDSHAEEHDRKVGEMIGTFCDLYVARATVFASPTRDKGADVEILAQAQARLERNSWSIDRRYGTSSMRGMAAESLSLLLASDVPPDAVMDTALKVRHGWSSHGAHELFHRLAAVPALHDALIEGLSQAAAAHRTLRSPAGERSESLSGYASLLARISPSDADAVFQWSIDVAGELDREVVDQLRLISRMVIQGQRHFGAKGLSLATELTQAIQDAAVRIESYDDFPWSDAIRAVAQLDYPAAVAAVARWDDAELTGLSRTLGPALDVGLQSGSLTASQAASLGVLLQHVDDGTLRLICDQAEREGKATASGLAEEFARDCQLDRLDGGDAIHAFVARFGEGDWSRGLQAWRVFSRGLEAASSAAALANDAVPEADGKPDVLPECWDEAVLVDADLLRAELDRIGEQSRQAHRYLSIEGILSSAAAHVPARLRVAHLDALARLDAVRGDSDALHALLARLETWAGSPAVAQWRNQRMTELLAKRLAVLCRYLPHHDVELQSSLTIARAANVALKDVLLRGIELNFDRFRAAGLFALSGIITGELPGDEVAGLCEWYIQRLAARIGDEDREDIDADAVPRQVAEALGRFFYALLGDVDVRVRWRCAHALRRLARRGEHTVLDAVVAQYARTDEPAFRAPGAPFYWLAARLWLVIAMDRIALESPAMAARHGAWLLRVAQDDGFPHLLVRGFARDACSKLIASGHLPADDGTNAALSQVNCSTLARSRKQRDYGRSFESFKQYDEGLRFHFDGLDTLRYWYEPFLRAFADVTPRDFLEAAEQLIVDAWGVHPDDDARLQDPRMHRFRDHNWALYSKSHGSNPTLEDLQAYLEWHAMWCVAGQLLRTHPLSARNYGRDELEERIEYNTLTMPPLWLADLAGPVPLQPSRWHAPSQVREWIDSVSDDELLAELLAVDMPDYVVVHAYIDDRSSEHHQSVRISTGLVSPDTAHALVRALQTTMDSSAFYICPEGHDLEIDDAGFRLEGWLTIQEGDTLLDEKDVFRNGIRRIDYRPGKSVTKHLKLVRRLEPEVGWYRTGEDTPSFLYQAWGYQETGTEREYRFGRTTESAGCRLLVSKRALGEFLDRKQQELIAEVEITRRGTKRSGYADHEEGRREAEFERILLLRRDGSIQAAERNLGAWRSSGL
ncbi:hypothetical protein [Acidovorax sp.]|uniref:hypothetical protein n=1 Tax=Acidovorax sp. TaxID=1872122 RepID=UPI003D06ACDF